MILDRLGVRGKLNLLLMLPLAAVVLVAVPFVAGQIENARSATATADAARNARQLGALAWELQRERLLMADFLADPTADNTPLLLQEQVVTDSANDLRAALGPNAPDELTGALTRLGSLDELRQNARQRGAALDSVARAYHAIIQALIDALRLVPQRTSDAEGTRQLTALDALLRANEESALRGMALIVAASSPQVGQDLLDTSTSQSQQFTERFVQQADVDQAGLVVLVDQGEAARRVDALVQRLPQVSGPTAVRDFVSAALAAGESQANLRRLVQDQVTSQIADNAASRAGTARDAAWTVSLGASLLFAIVFGLAVAVSRSIAHPLQRLTRAATTVADLANAELVRVTDVERTDEQPPRLAAIDVASGDEIGELAVAFNRVQASAALMLERQVVTRRNVSLMFANVAQRTQNLVRRQLALVDELERDEQNSRLLTRLYRLDHLSTRLRRNADNLLVVAGARDETRITAPTPITTVLRSALAEIEDYQRVSFGAVHEVTVAAPLVADLVLLFAELLENATAFSPPESTVDVHASLVDGGCQVSIVDHGIGMTPQKLAEENRRLVERERLDIVPTTVLGLFVVGRLARRHGLTVELVPTAGGGTTATVLLPPTMYGSGGLGTAAPALTRAPASFARRPAISPAPVAIPAIPAVAGSFSWFSTSTDELPTVPPQPEPPAEEPAKVEVVGPPAPPAPAPAQRGNLSRRVPGAQLPAAALRGADGAVAGRTVHDASAARSAMDGFQSAVARAAGMPAPTPAPAPRAAPAPLTAPRTAPAPAAAPTDGGFALTRRTPGAHLAPGLREAPPGTPVRRPPAPAMRDPEAERAAFDGFAAGLAQALQAAPGPDHDEQPRTTKESTP
jgi:signal transduction histidine kinase